MRNMSKQFARLTEAVPDSPSTTGFGGGLGKAVKLQKICRAKPLIRRGLSLSFLEDSALTAQANR